MKEKQQMIPIQIIHNTMNENIQGDGNMVNLYTYILDQLWFVKSPDPQFKSVIPISIITQYQKCH